MNKPNLMPQPAQPVNRVTTGQLPPELAELSEEALQVQGVVASSASSSSATVLASALCGCACLCSYDGDDAE